MKKPDNLCDKEWERIIERVEKQLNSLLKNNYFFTAIIDPTIEEFIKLLKENYENEPDDWSSSFEPAQDDLPKETFIVDSPWGGRYQIVAKELRAPLPDYQSKIEAYREYLIKRELEDLGLTDEED